MQGEERSGIGRPLRGALPLPPFAVRLHTATELIRAMQDVGCTGVDAYGGLDASSLDPARRVVVRGVRPLDDPFGTGLLPTPLSLGS